MQRRQHQVSGQRGLDRDARGLEIAHFADHDDVRILTHDRAQRVREVEANGRLGLDLVDAFDLVFDRILDRDDLDVGRVELGERRVQRRRLARAGRARDQHDAVRKLQHVDEFRQELIGEAERVEIEHDRFAVEDTHDHRFAVRGRHGRHAKVELLALHADHDAAVLRQAALGDVELGHDLDARDHRRGRRRRRRFDFVQHAVDAVAHLQAILERLDVDIRRALLDRALDDEIDEADDRRFGGEIAQMLDVVFAAVVVVGQVLDDRAHRRSARAVVALDQIVDLAAHADVELDRAPGRELERLHRKAVRRIGDEQRDVAVALADRTDVVVLQEAHRRLHVRRRRLRKFLGRQQRQRRAVRTRASAISRSETRPSRVSSETRLPDAGSSSCRRRPRTRSVSLRWPRATRNWQMRSSRLPSARRRDGGDGCNGGHGVLMFCDGYFDPTANCSIPDARAR